MCLKILDSNGFKTKQLMPKVLVNQPTSDDPGRDLNRGQLDDNSEILSGNIHVCSFPG